MTFPSKAILKPLLLLLASLQACGPTEVQDMSFQDQASIYAQHHPGFTGGSSRLESGEIGVYLLPGDGAVLLDIGMLRVALLGRSDNKGFSSLMRVNGSRPKTVGNGNPFSFKYADGVTDCKAYGLKFTCSEGSLHIAGQAFPYDEPRVVLVNEQNAVVFSQAGSHTGLTLRGAPVLPEPLTD